MPAQLLGRTLGDFEIESDLGQGSMARVYRAKQISLGRSVALKVLEENLFTPGENIRRFLREAAALARLEHPHIVPIYAAGDEEPYYFFAMRLIAGGTLASAMQSGIGRRTAVEWAYQIGRALAYAHAEGIVHRDLKPTNILLQDGVAFLSDFGLAHLRDLSTLTRSGFTLGTPLYMAPEQTRGEATGPHSDCFALGVILYQALTGKHPFLDQAWQGKTRAERRTLLFEKIRGSVYAPPESERPDLGPALRRTVHRALQADPAQRYPNGAAMLEDLREAWQEVRGDAQTVRANPSGIESSARYPAVPRLEGAPPPRPPSSRDEPLDEDATQDIAPVADFGRYQLLREIGSGGQGIVYHAYDTVLDRDVALKVLQATFHADQEMLALFRHEAQVAARLNHTHIVPIFDFGIQQGSPFLIMPLVEGPSLDRLIARRGALPAAFALSVLAQAVDALAYAHSRGVVHLDVKPGNILLRLDAPALPSSGALGEPSILLTDFTMADWFRAGEAHAGAGRKRDSRRAERHHGGTLPYAAPEQLDEGLPAPGPASDYYALGVVGYEMLTGSRLFGAPDLGVTRRLTLSSQIEPPSKRRPELSSALDALCLDLLHSDATQRLADPLLLRERIRTLQNWSAG
ncbi:MAG: serine/threonine protein kinase [Planctomycetes bacterium]|nr:serine/threonine protein kinase [Planctomycetota bacterium]